MPILYSPGVERRLYQFAREVYEEFQVAFDALERDPFEPGPSFRVKRLGGTSGDWVVRWRNLGAIYRVEGRNVIIKKVEFRSGLYG